MYTQLTLEQNGFEMQGSAFTGIFFFNKYMNYEKVHRRDNAIILFSIFLLHVIIHHTDLSIPHKKSYLTLLLMAL